MFWCFTYSESDVPAQSHVLRKWRCACFLMVGTIGNSPAEDVELFLRDGKIFNPKIDFFSPYFLVAAENEIYLHKLQAKRFVFPASSSCVSGSKAVNGASNYTNFSQINTINIKLLVKNWWYMTSFGSNEYSTAIFIL